MPLNDKNVSMAAAPPSADAHGQAALMLVESLIHALCAKSILSIGEAVALTERAIDTQFHRSEEAESAEAVNWRPHALLMSIAATLRTDIPAEPRPPHA